MKFTHLLCSSKPPITSTPKWRIPEEKKWININYRVSKDTPKQLFWRAINAPYGTYFKVIGSIAVVGVVGMGMQYFHTQYKLRTSDYAMSALKTLEKFPQLTDMLGCPLKSGHAFPSVKGGIKDNEVRISLPLHGKNSSGILYYHAVKDNEIWIIRSMKFIFTDRAGGIVRLVKDVDEGE